MILRMRERIGRMQHQMEAMRDADAGFVRSMQAEMIKRIASASANPGAGALVPVRRTSPQVQSTDRRDVRCSQSTPPEGDMTGAR